MTEVTVSPNPALPCKPVTFMWPDAATRQLYLAGSPLPGQQSYATLQIDFQTANLTIIPIFDIESSKFVTVTNNATPNFINIDFNMTIVGDRSCYVEPTLTNATTPPPTSDTDAWIVGPVEQCGVTQFHWSSGQQPTQPRYTLAFELSTLLPVLSCSLNINFPVYANSSQLKLPLRTGLRFSWTVAEANQTINLIKNSPPPVVVSDSNDTSCVFDVFDVNSTNSGSTSTSTPLATSDGGSSSNTAVNRSVPIGAVVGGTIGGLLLCALLIIIFKKWRQRRHIVGLLETTEPREDTEHVSPFVQLRPTPLILPRGSVKNGGTLTSPDVNEGNAEASNASAVPTAGSPIQNRDLLIEEPLYHVDGGRLEFPPSYNQVNNSDQVPR